MFFYLVGYFDVLKNLLKRLTTISSRGTCWSTKKDETIRKQMITFPLKPMSIFLPYKKCELSLDSLI